MQDRITHFPSSRAVFRVLAIEWGEVRTVWSKAIATRGAPPVGKLLCRVATKACIPYPGCIVGGMLYVRWFELGKKEVLTRNERKEKVLRMKKCEEKEKAVLESNR